MHPRVCLHQVGFLSEPTPAFVQFCRELGVAHMTLASPHLLGPHALPATLSALATGGPTVASLTQPFAVHPDLDADTGLAAQRLNQGIEAAAALGARHLYILTGPRGRLDWEAADRHGIALSVETANLLNADLHIAHTLDDTIRLAELAGIGVTIDLGACWFEGGLAEKFRRAMPLTRLVQLSDYVPGDRSTPCRAVPGDGTVPLERLLGQWLDLGYAGLFDLELTGPRIVAEGHRAAHARAAAILSETLTRLGA